MTLVEHDLIYIYQDRVWVDRERRRLAISEMDPGHAGNAARMFVRNCGRSPLMALTRAKDMVIEMASMPNEDEFGDMASLEIERMNGEHIDFLVGESPEDWARRQPLVRALVRRWRQTKSDRETWSDWRLRIGEGATA